VYARYEEDQGCDLEGLRSLPDDKGEGGGGGGDREAAEPERVSAVDCSRGGGGGVVVEMMSLGTELWEGDQIGVYGKGFSLGVGSVVLGFGFYCGRALEAMISLAGFFYGFFLNSCICISTYCHVQFSPHKCHVTVFQEHRE
jgi:hypothetical protein